MITDRYGNPWLVPSCRLSDREIPELLRRHGWRLERAEKSGFASINLWRVINREGAVVASGRTRQLAVKRAAGIYAPELAS